MSRKSKIKLVDAQGNPTQPTGPIATVAICIPHGDMVPWSFANDLARMMTFTAMAAPGIKMYLLFCGGSLIPKQREQLAWAAVSRPETTHVLWLDSDMRFPNDLLIRMLVHALPAVCASYTERNPPFRPVAFADKANFDLRVWPTEDATGLTKIAACGMGCMLIHADVFRAIERPWFCVAYNYQGGTFMGEDVYFCLKLSEMTDLWLDQDITKEVFHTGRFEFGAEHAVKYGQEHGLMKAVEPELTTLATAPTSPDGDPKIEE